MALNDLEKRRAANAVSAYLDKRRPPAHIRDQLDIGYRISGQSVELFEVRPMWKNPTEKLEHGIAKATYVRTRDEWKIFWLRQDLKWHSYEPHPLAKDIEEFLSVVEEDRYSCFYG